MISPQMTFRKNIQLPITDLEEAKRFARTTNEKFLAIVKESFPESLFSTYYEEKENGNLVHSVANDSFEGVFEVVVGWDQKNIDGQNVKFMALNTSGRGESISFMHKEQSIRKLPDKGYYGGALAGGLLGFIVSMLYAYESDDINLLMFFVVMIVTGWIGMMTGSVLGNKMLDKLYDKAQAEAMNDQLFLQSSGPWLSFTEKIENKMDEILEADKANASE